MAASGTPGGSGGRTPERLTRGGSRRPLGSPRLLKTISRDVYQNYFTARALNGVSFEIHSSRSVYRYQRDAVQLIAASRSPGGAGGGALEKPAKGGSGGTARSAGGSGGGAPRQYWGVRGEGCLPGRRRSSSPSLRSGGRLLNHNPKDGLIIFFWTQY